MASDDYLDLRLGDFLESVAEGGRAPGGGSAAAFTVALAAGLVAMVARSSRGSWKEASAAGAQATSLLQRIVPLVRTDADAWEDALGELRAAAEGASAEVLAQKLEGAAAVPALIAEAAVDAALLGELAADRGEGSYRADAAVAAVLAAAAAQGAAHLVEVNLAVREDDPRLAQARASAEAAAGAAARALDAAR